MFEFLVQHPTGSQKLSRTFLAPIDEGRVQSRGRFLLATPGKLPQNASGYADHQLSTR